MEKKWILLIILWIVLLGGCTSPNPIDTGNPVDFQHRTTVFTMQAPGNWKQVQDAAPTEALGIFSDPTGEASIVAYAGLLDRRLEDEEGLTIVGQLASTLLRDPADYRVTEQRRHPDGTFEVRFTFSRSEQKFTGRAIFRDTDLTLSGVIMEGPEQNWSSLETALSPYVDSFRIDPEVVRAAYFDILEDIYYILVVPIDWPQQRGVDGVEIQSRNQRMSILLVQENLGQAIDPAALADQAAASLRRSFRLVAKVTASEKLADGRLRVTLDEGDQRILGFVEQFDTHFVGLFFKIPSDRAEDYQPFMDFVYSTYISGLP